MKRLLIAEEILVAFFYAAGYGTGYIIPKSLGKSEIFCILISILAGLLFGFLGGKLVKIWSKKSVTNRDLMFIALSDLGKSVKCFYWEVNSPVKKFGGNSISMVGALLENVGTAEKLGYLVNHTVADVFQHLIYNELIKDNADLTNNEVRGVHEIKWKSFHSAYPMILHITDDDIELDDNILIEEINTIKKWNQS